MCGRHQPNWWKRIEKIAKVGATVAGAAYALTETAEILSHVHW